MFNDLKKRITAVLPRFRSSYEKAVQEEDERQGYYRDQANRWFSISVGLAVLLAINQFYAFQLGKQPKLAPFYVTVNEQGEATNIINAEEVTWSVDEAARKREITRFITNSRTVSLDNVVNNTRTSEAYRQSTAAAQRKLALYFESGGEDGDPMAASSRSSDVTVQLTDFTLSKRAGTDSSYVVRWKEKIYSRTTGKLIENSPQPWIADITIAIVPPENEQQLREFPLGVYIADYAWSQN